jgi:eukaryotic-like serine/threonine-protein kinase
VSSGGRPRTLAGRYRLDEVIGRGGMSTVYRGTDLALERPVAVKVALDPLAEENPTYVARFKREARAAAAINDAGVVTVYDAGADGPTRYIVMEFVAGKSLSDLLREHRPLEPRRAAYIADQVATTLAAAHAVGIVHRDIKPGNIMVEANDRVKVLDFGIARTADAVTLTKTASVLGTAPYMAPEQAMGNPADARSDIYSLGCVLYEMLTGQPPFMADLPAAVMHQHVRTPPKPPRERNPDVPPALDALVLQMLAKNPDDRPQTAGEVRDRLAAYLRGVEEPPTAPTERIAPVEALAAAADAPQAATVPQPATVAPEATAATRALPPPMEPTRRRGAGLYVALAAIAVVLLGAAVAYAIAGGGSSHSTSTSSHSASHATTPATTPPTSTPHTSSTPSTSSSTTASTTTTTTTTTTTSSTPTTTVSTPTTTFTPPGQGGTPPGQAKKSTTTQ